MSVARFKVCAKMSMASRPSYATVTIDRGANLFSVRELRRRRVYTLPLDAVAGMVVRSMIVAEVREKRIAKKARRSR
jgi:hypothetical protein